MKPLSATLHENLPLIQVSDKTLLDTLLADARAAQYILARLDDRAAIVAPGKMDHLLAYLRKQGHTPQVQPD